MRISELIYSNMTGMKVSCMYTLIATVKPDTSFTVNIKALIVIYAQVGSLILPLCAFSVSNMHVKSLCVFLKVKWAEQQVVKQRKKRDIYSEPVDPKFAQQWYLVSCTPIHTRADVVSKSLLPQPNSLVHNEGVSLGSKKEGHVFCIMGLNTVQLKLNQCWLPSIQHMRNHMGRNLWTPDHNLTKRLWDDRGHGLHPKPVHPASVPDLTNAVGTEWKISTDMLQHRVKNLPKRLALGLTFLSGRCPQIYSRIVYE